MKIKSLDISTIAVIRYGLEGHNLTLGCGFGHFCHCFALHDTVVSTISYGVCVGLL